MRVILDTNVIISGIFFHGNPSRILKAWKSGNIRLVASSEIFDEYQEVLRRLSARYPKIEIGPLVDLLAVELELIKPRKLKKRICDDPDDDKFFECALSAGIKLIVSGDNDLLSVSGALNVQVMEPMRFVQKYLA